MHLHTAAWPSANLSYQQQSPCVVTRNVLAAATLLQFTLLLWNVHRAVFHRPSLPAMTGHPAVSRSVYRRPAQAATYKIVVLQVVILTRAGPARVLAFPIASRSATYPAPPRQVLAVQEADSPFRALAHPSATTPRAPPNLSLGGLGLQSEAPMPPSTAMGTPRA